MAVVFSKTDNTPFLRNFDSKAHIIMQQYAVSRRLFTDPKMRDLE